MKPSRNILFTFGINGSLRKKEHLTHNNPVEHYLFNSAANFKAYSNNGLDFAYYGYNASNTRAYKLSMLNMNQWVNGQLVSLLFLCSPKESLRQASKKELVRFLEREQTSPKVTEQKERAFAAVEKNPVHNARQLAERRYPLRSHPSCLRPGFPSFGEIQTSLYSALTIGKRSAPLPCYGRRIFFITPQVCDMTLTTCEIQRLQQWQDATLSSEVPPCNLLFSIAYGQVCLRSAKMMQASLLHSLRANSLCFVSFFFSGRRKKERNEGKNFYYHTNHLGSTAFVTDQNQNITQGFLYAPFGEITTEYAPSWQNGTLPKYSFNAKELDEETGMYYYEARYYKPQVFTSRDPMFEKKPWSSPYVYCKNNPIIMIDPDGRDEYEVDLVNKTVSTVKGTEGTPDKFTVIDKDGNRISSNSYKNGTIKKFDSKSAASFEIDGDAAGKELFEFLADNTGVEWACLATGEDANGTNYLLTDFNENEVNVNTENMDNNYIRIYNHNHTNSEINYPSPADLKLIKELQYRNLRIKYLPYMWPLTSDNEETICTPVSNIYVNKRYVPYTPKPKSLYRDPILESSPSVKTPIPLP
ncbi:MAG: hypothetical protein IKO59_01175 [Bacteroidales bacterium]|nr:hypothetical protein [Bacteroidales bacterium]